MKKKLLAAFAALAIVSAPAAALADADEVTVRLNGGILSFDVPPQIINERTMVPLRAIFEALGATVDWDQATETVTSVRGDTTIKMTIGQYTMYLNDTPIEMDVAPVIIDERTLVPVRAIAEGFGASVDWDAERWCVIISSDHESGVIPSDEPADKPQDAPEEKPSEAPADKPADAPEEKPSEAPAKPASDIVIDTSSGLLTDSVNTFNIKEITKTADGNYHIKFTFYTFLEGAGSVTATFNCLDADGKVVDSFGGSYKTIDYTQTPQEDEATISGKTVKIVLSNG